MIKDKYYRPIAKNDLLIIKLITGKKIKVIAIYKVEQCDEKDIQLVLLNIAQGNKCGVVPHRLHSLTNDLEVGNKNLYKDRLYVTKFTYVNEKGKEKTIYERTCDITIINKTRL